MGETAAYCHFGREPVTKDGKKFFEWENAKDLKKYAPMSSAQVAAALKSSNYLTKWVDWSTDLAPARVVPRALLPGVQCPLPSFDMFYPSIPMQHFCLVDLLQIGLSHSGLAVPVPDPLALLFTCRGRVREEGRFAGLATQCVAMCTVEIR